MIDFTKKGTKLPIIPIGTKFKWLKNGEFKEPGVSNKNGIYPERPSFISFGSYRNGNNIYVICDDEYAQTSNMQFLIKLSTIERLAKEQWMYNTNNEQMKTQVTLNAYGGVVVTENNTTTIHSKETTLQIYEVVKADLEKTKLEVGKWYENTDFLICYIGNDDCYGFDKYNMNFHEKLNHSKSNHISGEYKPASPEKVETALRNEFIRLGGKVGAKVECLALKESIETITAMDFYFEADQNRLWVKSNTDCSNRGACVFDNGKFATITQPETISIQEAEKRTVFVVRHKDTGNDFGTFSTKEKAEKYIAASSNFTIVENTVN